MVVKNLTVISKEEVFKTLVASGRKELISKYILAVIILACGFGIMLNGILTTNTLYTVVGIAFGAFGIAYLGLNTYSMLTMKKRIRKQNEDILNNDINYLYTIKEKSITVSILNTGKKNEVVYLFENVKKVFEEETRYVLRLSDNQVLYINKNSFETEQGEKFFLRDLEINKTKYKPLKK